MSDPTNVDAEHDEDVYDASHGVLRIEYIHRRNPLAGQRHSYRRRVNGEKLGGPGQFHTKESHALRMALRTSGVTRLEEGGLALVHPYYRRVVLIGWSPATEAYAISHLKVLP